MSLTEFWDATPRLLWLARRAYHRRRAWLAWHVAALQRAGEFPDLAEFMGEPAVVPNEEQSLEKLLFAMRLTKAKMSAAGLN